MIRANGNKAAVIENMKGLHPLNPEDQIREAVYEAEARLKSQGVRGHDRIKPWEMRTVGYIDAKEDGKGIIMSEQSMSLERTLEVTRNAEAEYHEKVPTDELVRFFKIQLIRNSNPKEAIHWVRIAYPSASYERLDEIGVIAEEELQKEGDDISMDEIARFIRAQRHRQDKTDIRKIIMGEYPYTPHSKINEAINITSP